MPLSRQYMAVDCWLWAGQFVADMRAAVAAFPASAPVHPAGAKTAVESAANQSPCRCTFETRYS